MTQSLLIVQVACFLIGAGLAAMLFWVIETPTVGIGWLAYGFAVAATGSLLHGYAVRLKVVGR